MLIKVNRDDVYTSLIFVLHYLGIIQRLHDEWYVYENCEFKRLNRVRRERLGLFSIMMTATRIQCYRSIDLLVSLSFWLLE